MSQVSNHVWQSQVQITKTARRILLTYRAAGCMPSSFSSHGQTTLSTDAEPSRRSTIAVCAQRNSVLVQPRRPSASHRFSSIATLPDDRRVIAIGRSTRQQSCSRSPIVVPDVCQLNASRFSEAAEEWEVVDDDPARWSVNSAARQSGRKRCIG